MATDEPQYTVEYVDDMPEESKWLKRAGTVKITYPNGDSYQGDVNTEKLKHGKGTYVWVEQKDDGAHDIATYYGSYIDGKKSGVGKMTFPNGDSYHGIWQNDLMHGEGTLVYANGDIFSGTFANGIKEGTGTYEFQKDQSQLVGDWKMGGIITGVWRFADGGNYTGAFENGKPIGSGMFNLPSGGLQQDGEYSKKQTESNDAGEPTFAYKWTGGTIVKSSA